MYLAKTLPKPCRNLAFFMFCKKSPVMSQDFPNHVRPPLGGNTKDPGGVPSFCQIRAQLVFHLLVIPEHISA